MNDTTVPCKKGELSGSKAALLKRLLSGDGAQSFPEETIPRGGSIEPYPLSFAQERLWFLGQYDRDSSAYNILTAVRLNGVRNRELVEGALQVIVARHDTLRTSFPAEGGEPVQEVAPSLQLELPVVDLRLLSENEQEPEIRRLATEASRTPFDLSRGALLRTVLLQTGETDFILLVMMHHIISDGWSIGIFIKELGVAYDALLRGESPSLPELPIQYGDFARWQRESLSQARLEGELSYWRETLSDPPAPLPLPVDHSRPLVQSYAGAIQSFRLPQAASEKVKQLSRREKVTPFITLLAALQTLLFRYTAAEDMAIGATVANRNRFEVENLIGFFVNTLVMRTNLGGNPTFIELLQRAKETALGAFAHQDIPFAKLVEDLHPERHSGHTPFFQVMFVYNDAPMLGMELPGFALTPLEIDNGTAKFDLTLQVIDAAGGMIVSIEYNTDLFLPETIKRLAGHYRMLLEGILERPQAPIAELPLLSSQELREMLCAWNDTGAKFGAQSCTHRLFEARAKERPADVALVLEGKEFTYDDLNRRSNQLAHYLQKRGVGPETLVGICMERSAEMVTGLLGIMKAGGAYVPLDPAYPQERLAFMLEDSRAALLLTELELAGKFPVGDAAVVCLDGEAAAIALESEDNPEKAPGSDNLAYVIYTSGSTGKPKGVQITHGALTNFLFSMGREPGLERRDSILAVTTICFDIAALELYLPLVTGARIVLCSREAAADGKALLQLLVQSQATVMQATPATWRMLLGSGWEGSFGLKMICGGEALSRELAEKLLEKGELWNLYGPTETTVWSAGCRVGAEIVREEREQAISIGTPIANTQIYLLDKWLNPVPVGVPGELHIAGAGVARGYLHRPELTAEKFISDPFSPQEGARMYKTGDLARYQSGGSIEYLGRIDQQIKVRGFRIELGEIESVLSTHPEVRHNVVVIREDAKKEKQIVAYVIGDGEISLYRDYLRQKLPNYMIPGSFVALESFPLTPNGKIDRGKLPDPDQLAREETPCPPRNPQEEIMAGIWRDILSRSQVGIEEDFFDIGGHSLLATQLVSRVREIFRLELPVKRIFETPTVAGLCSYLASCGGSDCLEFPAPMALADRGKDIPLSFAQERLWFLNSFQEGNPAYNMPVALEIRGELNHELLERSLGEIVRRHEALRTVFSSAGGKPAQVILQSAALPFSLLELPPSDEECREKGIARLAAEEAGRPFDLGAGPLIRCTLLRESALRHVLLITMHHIVSDGWSLGVLVREFKALYQAFSAGGVSPLPELPFQYADFALWQRSWLNGGALEGTLDYWRRQLKGAPVLLELPTDRPRPARQSFRGETVHFQLGADLTKRVKTLTRRQGATLFMTLQAAFSILLCRYSGSEDIVVGTPIANRNRQQIEGLIGFFANTLLLRTDLGGDPSFEELLMRVRAMTLDAYANQDVPFERLVEELQPERSQSHNPLFQVLFVLQNAPLEALEVPGLELNVLETENSRSRFDLEVHLREEGDALSGCFIYNTDLFDADTVQRMSGHFLVLLNGITNKPCGPISGLSLLTPKERVIVLEEWPEGAPRESAGRTLSEWFEAQVEESSALPALYFRDAQLSYAELNRRANELAHLLRDKGVGPDLPVAIMLERSPEMIVAVLGVLKAGGAYLPLDPQAPRQRILCVLEQSGSPLLVTRGEDLFPRNECPARIEVLDLEALPAGAPQRRENPPRINVPSDLACVIYTSGSTGSPKGVCLPHSTLTNLVEWHHGSFAPSARTLQFAPLSFDVSFHEIFGALLGGGSLCLVPEETRRDARELACLLAKGRVEKAILPAVVLQQLAEEHARTPLPDSLVEVLVTGEQLQVGRKLREMFTSLPHCTLHNIYGPTEAQVVTALQLGPDPKGWKALPAIGRPVDNARVYILDEKLAPVPVGVPGELWVAGPGLSRGYLNCEELTAERFLPDPFSHDPADRIYRSGDRCRWLSGGEIEFLGRADRQLKFRGFRVEPAEVEAALALHPAVREALVVVREDAGGPKRLVGYLLLQEGWPAAPGAAELKGYLAQSLPDYMIPSLWVPLDFFPVNANGKIDRKALPAPDAALSPAGSPYLPPATPTEERLCAVWGELLGVERVGSCDNFFALGGHSLLATQLVSRLRDAFSLELTVRDLFDRQTVGELAGYIDVHTFNAPWQSSELCLAEHREEMVI